MRFKIESAWVYDKKILDKYPILKNYNMIIDHPYENKNTERVTIELKNIEDLIKLYNELKQELIIRDEDYCFNNETRHYSILIYDDYIE